VEKFTEVENAKVEALLKVLGTTRRHQLPLALLFEYDDELFQYAERGHPKAEEFYLS